MPPNVLVVVLDTARRDSVEPYAAPGSTPAIADLARRGTAFQHAYSTACWTLPSHASMFTGMMPRALGLTQLQPGESFPDARPRLEAQRERLLPEVLRRAGYRTQCVSTNMWISPHVGFDIGFDDFRLVNKSRQALLEGGLGTGWRSRLRWAREGVSSARDDGAREAGGVLRDWIGDHSGEPTFWFVNLLECHSPYLPPRPWSDLRALDRALAGLEARRYLSFETSCRICAGGLEVPRPALERMRHLYSRAVAYMDDWLAHILEALDRKGILDETLVIATSDHGENFGEGGLIAHGFSLDDRLIGVPFVMAGPGAAPQDGAFSLASLPRLIADAVELSDHPWPAEDLPQGVAAAQFDPPTRADHPAMQQFVAKWSLGERGSERLTPVLASATDGRSKLLVRNGVEQKYDLVTDPLEQTPLDADGVGHLRAALEHRSVIREQPVHPPGPPPAAASEAELEQLERQMKLLGYM